MIPGVNYVMYGCSSTITTLRVSLYQGLTLKQNIIEVVTQDRVIDYNLTMQMKNRTLYTYF